MTVQDNNQIPEINNIDDITDERQLTLAFIRRFDKILSLMDGRLPHGTYEDMITVAAMDQRSNRHLMVDIATSLKNIENILSRILITDTNLFTIIDSMNTRIISLEETSKRVVAQTTLIAQNTM